MLELEVNGVRHALDVDPALPLLQVLRDDLGLTGAKLGCGLEQCYACAVIAGDEVVTTCVAPAADFVGRPITTVEGLGTPEQLSSVQAAFHQEYGSQCGFCTPGMLIATHALLERTPKPSRGEIEDALRGHVCRCTGYVKIIDAVEAAANGKGAEA